MSTDFVPTKASLKAKSQKDYQEVTFVAYKSKKKEKKVENPNEEIQNTSEAEFNIRKVKHEILKLGMSGFDPLKKEEAKIQQLIKLGAMPPKKKFQNYKLLINKKKVEKEEQANERKFQQLGKNSVGKSVAKGKSFDRKRRKEGILDIYGKIVRDKARTEKK